MAADYVLDTNMASLLVRRDPVVLSTAAGAGSIFIPCIVFGELYYGVQRILNTRRGKSLRADYGRLAARFPVLPCDLTTAEIYARVRAGLEQKGQRIPENDMWIAALALQYQLALATRDAHFACVSGLIVDQW